MGINENFIKIEKKFAWSFFGFLLALILGGFSIYTVYFKNTNPKLDFTIETNTKVLDLRENVKKLNIFYNNENIKENGKNLSVIKIRIGNTSQVNILSNFYDLNDLPGFKLENGDIVERPEIVDASNEYIKHNLSFKIDTLGNLHFNPIIIESGDYFVLKILALHSKNDIPTVKPIGKIAGVKTFNVVEAFKTNLSTSFWTSLIQGSFWVHVLRFFIYLGIIVVTVVIIVLPISSLSDYFTSNRKKRIVKEYKKLYNPKESSETNLVFNVYIDYNLQYLINIQKDLIDEDKLKMRLRKYLRSKDKQQTDEYTYIEENGPHGQITVRTVNGFVNNVIKTLSDEKIIKIENNQLAINTDFVAELDKFISFVKLF